MTVDTKTISDLQHITRELHTLHKEGIKHGDIRLWNMVFAKNGAKLLDFDFSGRNVYYPDGYAKQLPDAGLRRPGTKHEKITEACDIEALLSVFLMFDVVVEEDDDDDIKLRVWWWFRTKTKAYEKLLEDSLEVLSWLIEQFELHSEVRIEINNPAARKDLQMLEAMNRSQTRGKPPN
jgi:serine/threonine protein kinase